MIKHKKVQNTMKKIMATILAIGVVLAMSATAFAAADASSPLPKSGGTTATNTNGLWSKDYSNHFFGNQLDTSQEKQLYNAMEKELISGKRTSISTVVFDDPILIDAAVNYSNEKEVTTQAAIYLQRALDAFRFDHPEMYWATGGSALMNIQVGTTTEDRGVILAAGVSFQALPGNNANDDKVIDSVVNSIVAKAKKETGDYNRLKVVHDSLASHIVFDKSNPPAKRSHQITGGLVDKKGVCETYAKSFKIIAERLGYETILVGGVGLDKGQEIPHMWNLVKVQGEWYAVDVTWDDQARTLHDFFLVGTDTVSPNIDKMAFSKSHIPEYTFYPVNYKNFGYPKISSSRLSSSNTKTSLPTVPRQRATSPQLPAPGADTSRALMDKYGAKELTAKTVLESFGKASSKTNPRVNISDVELLTAEATVEINAATKSVGDFIIYANTVNDKGETEGRIHLTKDFLTTHAMGLYLTVETNPTATKTVSGFFDKNFKQAYIPISFRHVGRLVKPVQVTIKADLSKMNTNSLQFYILNNQGGFTHLPDVAYTVTKQGDLSFKTSRLGEIVVTDSLLVQK